MDFSSGSFPVLKMFDAMLRAVATGTPSARCPSVMHVYTSILFEHGAQFLLYGEYLNLDQIWIVDILTSYNLQDCTSL